MAKVNYANTLLQSFDSDLEIYDQQDANRVDGFAKGRQTTLGLGGRHAFDRKHSTTLLLMGGRSFQKVASDNVQQVGSPT
jgi:hypothetical protein